MDIERARKLFYSFDTRDEFVDAVPYGGGHINDTFRITSLHGKYTLQRINDKVFTDPAGLMRNIDAITAHIGAKISAEGLDFERRTLRVIKTGLGESVLATEDGFYRMFSFVDGAKTYKKSENPATVKGAGTAFGAFGRRLLDFPAKTLAVTIPNFHDTPSRYRALCEAERLDVCGRRREAARELEYFHSNADFYPTVTDAIASGAVPLRVVHNDTKLDNVLFDELTDEEICVIDLDTVMPDSLLYDYGDGIRSMTNSASEDETDIRRVSCRLDMLEAFTEGYLSELGGELTETERALLPEVGKLLTLECAMRFLTDYLSGDVYFKTSCPRQNLDRARVGIALATDMTKKTEEIRKIIEKSFK